MKAEMFQPLFVVKDLVKNYPVKNGLFGVTQSLMAIQGVSFPIVKGETLGLVGESGCGKSSLGRVLLKLTEATSGEIFFDGKNLAPLSRSAMKPFRKRMQMIFQDPYSSLNPRMMVGETLEEPMIIHGLYPKSGSRRERVKELLSLVGLPQSALTRYPHEFSGGQRQRIGIARALAVEPEFIVCDEPVSALDVSIQAQILNLLLELQERLGLTYLFISHDLRAVEYLSHRMAVMYSGKIVEMGATKEVCARPKHPYTQALLSAVVSPNAKLKRNRIVLAGEPPQAFTVGQGCPFEPRCFKAEDRCRREIPVLAVKKNSDGSPGSEAACLLV